MKENQNLLTFKKLMLMIIMRHKKKFQKKKKNNLINQINNTKKNFKFYKLKQNLNCIF